MLHPACGVVSRMYYTDPLPGAYTRSDQSARPVQVILAFSRPFWPQGFFDVVCPDCLIPEFWVTEYPATSCDARTSGLVCMTGFVAGARAEELSSWPQTHLIFKALAQLDEMFGT